MALYYDIVGWEDFDGGRQVGEPPELSDTMGVMVHQYSLDGEVEAYFWAWSFGDFESWDEWYDYIEFIATTSGAVGYE